MRKMQLAVRLDEEVVAMLDELTYLHEVKRSGILAALIQRAYYGDIVVRANGHHDATATVGVKLRPN